MELESKDDKKPFSSSEDEYEIPSIDTKSTAGKAELVKLQENHIYETTDFIRP